MEPAREEGTLCKKHHQRREQHELNTDNVDKYMYIELVLRELTHHGQRRMAAPVVSIRAQTLTQLVPAPVLKDVRRHEQPTWIVHATVAAAGHEVDAVLLLCRWRAVRDESIKRNIRAGGSLSAQSAARTVDDAGVVLCSEVRYWHEQEHRDGICRRSHVVVVIRALLDKTGNLQTSSAPCSFCKTDGC